MLVMVEIKMMHMMYEHIVIIVRGCIKMMQTIQPYEYLNEVMEKELTTKHVTTTILYPMMDVVLTDHKSRFHGYVLEALILQKMNENFVIQQQDGILIMM